MSSRICHIPMATKKCVDVLAFNIVSRTSDADDVSEMAETTDMMIGLKGDKGDKGDGLDYNNDSKKSHL